MTKYLSIMGVNPYKKGFLQFTVELFKLLAAASNIFETFRFWLKVACSFLGHEFFFFLKTVKRGPRFHLQWNKMGSVTCSYCSVGYLKFRLTHLHHTLRSSPRL